MQSAERQESLPVDSQSQESQEPQKKKQRRSRAGCLTCRSSRKGCDEIRPRCGRCSKLNYECIWPEVRKPQPSAKSRISKERLEQGVSAEQENPFYTEAPAFPQSRMFNAPSTSSSAPPTPLVSNPASTPVMPAITPAPLFQSIHGGTNVLNSTYRPTLLPSYNSNNRSTGIPDSLVRSFHPPPSPALRSGSSGPGLNSNNTFATETVMPFATESPSTAISANFWDDHQLYGLDYDYRELDSLLALLGQTSSASPGTASQVLSGGPTSFLGQPGQIQQQHLLPNSHLQSIQNSNHQVVHRSQARQDQLVLPRDKLRAMSKVIPKRCYAFLERMIEEQDNGTGEATLPIAYLINLAMWTPPTIIEDLVAQATEIYIQGSPLREFIQEIDEAIWPILLSKPTKSVKLSITLEQIIDLQDVSFHNKIYALMDMAYHNLYVEGAKTFYSDFHKISNFVKTHYKRPNQVVDLAKLANKKDFGIAVYMYADLLASIALGRPTTFPVTYTQDVNDPEQMRYVIGIEHLLCIAADIANLKFLLDRDPTSRLNDGTLNPLYKAQADRLQARIRTSTCCLPFEEEDDSIHYLSLLAAQELWRQAIFIHFYQSIYKLPNTDARLIKCMKQIIELWKCTRNNGGEPDMLKMAATAGAPLFLACTVAREKQDIDRFRGFYTELESTCSADEQTTEFVEFLWAEQARLQRPIDWHDYASEERGPAFP